MNYHTDKEMKKIANTDNNEMYQDKIDKLTEESISQSKKAIPQVLAGGIAAKKGLDTISKVNARGGLTGRAKIYHGSNWLQSNIVRDKGLIPTNWVLSPRARLPIGQRIITGMISPDDYTYSYATPSKKKARKYARGRKKDIIEMNIPFEEYERIKHLKNPELMGANNLKEYLENAEELRKRLPGGIKSEKNLGRTIKDVLNYNLIKDDIIFDNIVLSKYIKGSKDYEKLTSKEIKNYIKNNPKRFKKNLGSAGLGTLGVLSGGYLIGKNYADAVKRNSEIANTKGKQLELIGDAEAFYKANKKNLGKYKNEYNRLNRATNKNQQQFMLNNSESILGAYGTSLGLLSAHKIKNPKLRKAMYGVTGLVGPALYIDGVRRNKQLTKDNNELLRAQEDFARRVTEEM